MDFEELARTLGLRIDTPVFGEPLRVALAALARQHEQPLERFLLESKVRGSRAYHAVVQQLSVRETYFFRAPRDFELITTFADELVAGGQSTLAVWSVGCATGEEVYSLAMALRRVPSARIIGSDACVSALELAKAGRYRSWSFRDRAPEELEGLVSIDGAWEVDDSLRRAVSFEELNLAHDAIEPPRGLGPALDLIVCRNVLVYLRPDVVERVLTGLTASLSPRGLLVLSPHELPASAPEGFAFAGDSGLRRVPVSRVTPAPRSSRPSQVPAAAGRRAPSVERAWAAADAGRLDEALALLDGLDQPEAMLLRAIVLAEKGQPARAEAVLRHLVILEPRSCAALLQLYLLYQRRDAAAEALATRERLNSLLSGRPLDEPVPMSRLNVGQVLAQVEAR